MKAWWFSSSLRKRLPEGTRCILGYLLGYNLIFATGIFVGIEWGNYWGGMEYKNWDRVGYIIIIYVLYIWYPGYTRIYPLSIAWSFFGLTLSWKIHCRCPLKKYMRSSGICWSGTPWKIYEGNIFLIIFVYFLIKKKIAKTYSLHRFLSWMKWISQEKS